MGKNDDPKYCAYPHMIGHLTQSCYILKDQIQTLVDVNVLELRPNLKTVTANMTTGLHISQILVILIDVELVPVAELHIPNMDQGNQKEEGHVSIPTTDEDRCWSIPTFYMVMTGQ